MACVLHGSCVHVSTHQKGSKGTNCITSTRVYGQRPCLVVWGAAGLDRVNNQAAEKPSRHAIILVARARACFKLLSTLEPLSPIW
jgi:hypothetical protein